MILGCVRGQDVVQRRPRQVRSCWVAAVDPAVARRVLEQADGALEKLHPADCLTHIGRGVDPWPRFLISLARSERLLHEGVRVAATVRTRSSISFIANSAAASKVASQELWSCLCHQHENEFDVDPLNCAATEQALVECDMSPATDEEGTR